MHFQLPEAVCLSVYSLVKIVIPVKILDKKWKTLS